MFFCLISLFEDVYKAVRRFVSVSYSVIAYKLFHAVLTKCRASHISKPLIKIRFDSLAAKLTTKRMTL